MVAILVPFLRTVGHEAMRHERCPYEGCVFGLAPEDIGEQPRRDFRDTEADQMTDCDAVICSAALPGDPRDNLNLAATYSAHCEENEGKLRLARVPRRVGVGRLLAVAYWDETNVLVQRGLPPPTDGSLNPTHLLNTIANGVWPRYALAAS